MGFRGSCHYCGAQGDVLEIHYRQNTGMLIMRQTKELAGVACKRCSVSAFWRMTLHTFFLGWWGTISFIVTPFFLINNFYYFASTLALKSSEATARASLDDQREYALALLATKDEATVVEVIAKQTGAPDEDVRTFVRSLRKSA